MSKAPHTCVYCGSTDNPASEEHIVQACIGGTLTINDFSQRRVCKTCNNGVLARLDAELCNRSYLSVIASQEIDRTIWQAWDVDHLSGDLLVEARPDWVGGELNGLVCYPQITFEQSGPEIRGDVAEADQYGRDEFRKVLVRAARTAYDRHVAGGKKQTIHFERLRSDAPMQRYRFAPRLFARKSIAEIAAGGDGQSFILRFIEPGDRERALEMLSRLDLDQKFTRWESKPGSHRPAIGVYFDAGDVVRALMKVGINLLAAFCAGTPVDNREFALATGLILGNTDVSPALLENNGFIDAVGVQDFARPGCHSFVLTHCDGWWIVYSSFFGGRIGSRAGFPGPNHEEWSTLTVHAPIRSREWQRTPSALLFPRLTRVQWGDPARLSPSLLLQSSSSRLIVEAVPRKKQQ